jgi:transcriptional regulator with PAS, ATPase and Fis domain
MVSQGTFREDLYYRLNVVKIDLPSLASRREDIPLLMDHFRERFNLKMNRRILSISPEVMDLFMHYNFPGNVRELENAIEHAFVLCHGSRIEREHLPAELLQNAKKAESKAPVAGDSLKAIATHTILNALKKHGGNRRKTAEELGISTVTLWRKLRDLKREIE